MTDFSQYQAKTPATQTPGSTDFSKYAVSPIQVSAPKTPSSLSQTIMNDISTRGENAANEILDTNQNPIVSGIKATAQGFGAISDVAGDIVRKVPGVGPIIDSTQKLAKKGFEVVTGKIADTNLFKEAAQYPEQTKNLEAALGGVSAGGDLANNILLAETVPKGITKTAQLAKEAQPVVTDFVKNLTQQSEKSIENTVLTKFEKGVKPSVAGAKTPTAVNRYRDDIVQASKTINENKSNLSFVDETGDAVTGQNPRSLQQLQDAVEQTKKFVFSKYDSLAKQAGESGIQVNMEPIAGELDTVINNKALKITSPETIKYAETLKDRLVNVGALDATTAQDVIQNYNKSLEAFYRNPSYETASRAQVDAMVANNMRKSLDEGISGLTSEQYGALKKQYGSLKSIEKDVVKATLRDARKNVKGLIDFSDVFSGGQIVSGILSLNPAQIAQGATQKILSEYIKYLNNPNRAIQKMFEAVEKLPSR